MKKYLFQCHEYCHIFVSLFHCVRITTVIGPGSILAGCQSVRPILDRILL